MSEEQLKAFLEKAKGDPSFLRRLRASKSNDEVVSIAKEHGYEFSTERLNQLTTAELEGIAGGGDYSCGYDGIPNTC